MTEPGACAAQLRALLASHGGASDAAVVQAVNAALDEVEPLQRCLRCHVLCAPGMACVGEHAEDNAEVPCRPAADEWDAALDAVLNEADKGDEFGPANYLLLARIVRRVREARRTADTTPEGEQ